MRLNRRIDGLAGFGRYCPQNAPRPLPRLPRLPGLPGLPRLPPLPSLLLHIPSTAPAPTAIHQPQEIGDWDMSWLMGAK